LGSFLLYGGKGGVPCETGRKSIFGGHFIRVLVYTEIGGLIKPGLWAMWWGLRIAEKPFLLLLQSLGKLQVGLIGSLNIFPFFSVYTDP